MSNEHAPKDDQDGDGNGDADGQIRGQIRGQIQGHSPSRTGSGALAVAVPWLGLVAATQYGYGRGAGDWIDIPTVLGVWTVAMLTWALVVAGVASPPGWLRSAGRAAKRALGRLRIETGIDFGGTPEYEPRVPPPLVRIGFVLAGATVLAFLSRDTFPGPVRAALIEIHPFVYAAYAAVLWGWTLLLAMTCCGVVGLHANDVIVNRARFAARQARWQAGLVATVVLLPAVATWTLPPWLPLPALFVGVLVGMVALLGGRQSQIRFLWRVRGKSEIHALPSGWLMAWGDLALSAVVTVTVLLTAGEAMRGVAGGAGTTTVIGVYAAWCGAMAIWTWVWAGPVRLLRLARRDPAQRVPAAIEFAGSPPSESVVETLTGRGFRVVSGSAEPVQRVRVWLDSSAPRGRASRRLAEAHPRADSDSDSVVAQWSVHPADLLHPDVLSELRAADRWLRRSELMVALRTLLASARKRTFKSGTGYWFAPHLWYVPAMSRDTDEEMSQTVGEPYHRILSMEARGHAFEVFGAVRVDLVFIEDGVPLDGVERVLLQIFDHYDVWGVDPIEDRHIFNVPGIRVLIHAFAFDEPLDEDGYPEPDYETLARGRVLHMMRDRGGGDLTDPADAPGGQRPRLEPVGTA